ncbi:MAG: hypothetical protein V4683_16275 [Bacteroidota bacterium]
MNTSKDKIDQLFHSFLNEHSLKPREEAWMKLEQKLKQKRKPTMPIWQRMSIAATLGLLLLMGVITFINEKELEVKPTLSSKKVEQNAEVASNSPVQESVKLAIDNKTTQFKQEKQSEKTSEQFLATRKRESKELFETVGQLKEQNETIEIAEQAKVELADNDTPSSEIQPIEGKKMTPKQEDLTIVFTVAEFKNNSQTPNEIEDFDKKEKYLSKLFRQLKNAKNGDRVDWKEVGFKPAKILARAENKLKNTKEDLTDSYQEAKSKTVF